MEINRVQSHTVKKRLKFQMFWQLTMSYLETLPELVYKNIVKYLDTKDRLNLRLSSRRMLEMSNWWDYKFQFWTIQFSRGDPLPDFVLNSNKKLLVYFNDVPTKLETSIIPFLAEHGPRIAKLDFSIGSLCTYESITNWLKLFRNLAEVRPKWEVLKDLSVDGLHLYFYQYFDKVFGCCENLLKSLSFVNVNLHSKTLSLTRLKCLTLSECKVDTKVLVHLAPTLENLTLHNMTHQKFNLSGLEEHPNAFTTLKSLTTVNCNIDVEKLIIKISGTLQYLKLEGFRCIRESPELMACQFPALKSVQLINGSGTNIIKFLGKCGATLENLELAGIRSQVSLYHLYQKMPRLKSLKLSLVKKTRVIDFFLASCLKLDRLQIEFKEDYLIWGTFSRETKTNLARSLALLKPWIESLPGKRLRRLEIKLNVWIEDVDHHNSFDLNLPAIRTLDVMKVRILGEMPAQVKDQFSALFSGDVKIERGDNYDYKFSRIYFLHADSDETMVEESLADNSSAGDNGDDSNADHIDQDARIAEYNDTGDDSIANHIDKDARIAEYNDNGDDSITDNIDHGACNSEHFGKDESTIKTNVDDAANAMHVDNDDSDCSANWEDLNSSGVKKTYYAPSEHTWNTEEEWTTDNDDDLTWTTDNDDDLTWITDNDDDLTWTTDNDDDLTWTTDNDDDLTMEEDSCDNNEIQNFWRPWE